MKGFKRPPKNPPHTQTVILQGSGDAPFLAVTKMGTSCMGHQTRLLGSS